MRPPAGPRRRDDDVTPDLARGYEYWAKIMVVNRGKAITLLVAFVGCVSSAATAVGIRYVGPKQDIERVEHKVDTLVRRVNRIEENAAEAREARMQINSRLDFVVYMQCVQLKRTDPAAVPALCNETRKP